VIMLEIFIKNVRELNVLFPFDILLINRSRLNNVLWNELKFDGLVDINSSNKSKNCN